jgi:hypothetical protein
MGLSYGQSEMNLKSKRGIGLLGAIGTLVVAGYLTSTGFCFSQGRYLEDAEFFDRAIAYHAKSIRELAEIGRPAAAGDISEFRQHHSACCEVMGKDFPLANGFFNNLLGFKSTWIRIRYELSAHELERAPKEGRFYEAFTGLSSCGHVFRSIGTRSNQL